MVVLAFLLGQISPSIVSLRDLVHQLQPELSQTVTVDPSLANQLIFLDRRSASADSCLKVVAEAANADLLKEGPGLSIRRSPTRIKAIEAHRTEERTKWIQAAVERTIVYRKRSLATGRVSEAVAEVMKRQGEELQNFMAGKAFNQGADDVRLLTPTMNFLLGLIEKIGPNKLAAIPTGSDVVYESKPCNYSSGPLPDLSSLTQRYETEQAIWSSSEIAPSAYNPVQFYQIKAKSLGIDPSLPTPTNWRFRAIASPSAVLCFLEGYDGAGNRVTSADLNAQSVPLARHSRAILTEMKGDPKANWITMRPTSQAAYDFFEVRNTEAKAPDWFTKPDIDDPLNYFVLDAIREIARQIPGDCCAISIPDCLWRDVINSVEKDRIGISALLQDLKEWEPYETFTTSQGVAFRPLNPLGSDSEFANRKLLSRIVSDYQNEDESTLRRLSKYFAAAATDPRGDSSHSFMTGSWPMNLNQYDQARPLKSGSDTSLLVMLGAISDDDWTQLELGKTMTIGQLGIAKQMLVLLAHDPTLQFDHPKPDLYRHALENLSEGGIDGIQLKLTYEIVPMTRVFGTRAMPKGFWNQGSLDLGYLHPLGLEAVGRENGKDVIKLTRQEFEDTQADLSFQSGQVQKTIVTVTLEPGVKIEWWVADRLSRVSDAFKYAYLPEATRAKVWEAECKGALDLAARVRTGGINVVPPDKP